MRTFRKRVSPPVQKRKTVAMQAYNEKDFHHWFGGARFSPPNLLCENIFTTGSRASYATDKTSTILLRRTTRKNRLIQNRYFHFFFLAPPISHHRLPPLFQVLGHFFTNLLIKAPLNPPTTLNSKFLTSNHSAITSLDLEC